ncbi:hypothetical protein POG22_09750 [Geitlerinema sp. CS-897]|nr:hypothetical protein [Geitlerinema sp. CS-897]
MDSTISPHPWASETLYAKALLYMEQMEANVVDEWQYGLWSALCLELLARAALAHISPILLADLNNWRNINYALGNAITAKKFSPTSIQTKEVLARLTELVPEFTQEVAGFCSKHVERRNAELHTGETIFTELGTSEWLPRFYEACKLLLESMDKSLSDFVKDSDQANSMIESLKDAAAKAVRQDINAHAKVWNNKSAEDRQEAISQANAWATRQSGHRVECPACKSPSLLQGSPSGKVSTKIVENEVIQQQSMLPSSFECIACRLKISGFSKLSSCGLGDAFSATTTYTPAEFFELYTEEDLEKRLEDVSDYEPDFNEYD